MSRNNNNIIQFNWNDFFLSAGLPKTVASKYALIFSEHRIQDNTLANLNKDTLSSMGIKTMSYVNAIQKHAKKIADGRNQRDLMTKHTMDCQKSRIVQPSLINRNNNNLIISRRPLQGAIIGNNNNHNSAPKNIKRKPLIHENGKKIFGENKMARGYPAKVTIINNDEKSKPYQPSSLIINKASVEQQKPQLQQEQQQPQLQHQQCKLNHNSVPSSCDNNSDNTITVANNVVSINVVPNNNNVTNNVVSKKNSKNINSPNIERHCRCQLLEERVQFLTKEVQSLKDVLELRDLELKSIKTKYQLAEMRSQELESAEQSVTNLTQRLEALEAAASQKNAIIAILKEENQSLREKYDKEQRERQKVLMKNEELEYSLSVIGSPNNKDSNFSFQVDNNDFVTPLRPAPHNNRYSMASVPVCRPTSCASYRKRSCNTVCKDLRKTTAFTEMDTHHISVCHDYEPHPFTLPTCTSPPSSPSFVNANKHKKDWPIIDSSRLDRKSPPKIDTFHQKKKEKEEEEEEEEDDEDEEFKDNNDNNNCDLLKSIPPHSHSILDSGIEDGFVSLK